MHFNVTTDNFPIYIALACTILSLLAYTSAACIRGSGAAARVTAFARRSYLISVASIGYATIYLLQQILSLSRYDIDYIYSYSGPDDLLIYRFSSLWAGHEGSLLFWALIGGLLGIGMLGRKNHPNLAAMAFWSSVQLFFVALLVITDPFAPLERFRPGVVGSGLRLELQNPWMAIHPPIVFLGYAALVAPAALAIQALVKGDLRRWAAHALPWALFGWVSLGAGLILGMVWSYEALGWGGYWGWDPVENSSLVPWIISTALVHGLLLQRYRNRMAWPNIILAMGTFLTVIAATFLTRSGVLSNVSKHSFADLGATKYLLGFLIFYAVFCAVLVILRSNSVKPAPDPLPETSKDFTIALGTILFVIYAVAVLVATVYPLFSTTHKMIEPGFYTNFSKPIALVTIALIMVASFMGWSRSDSQRPEWRFSPRLWKTGAHVAHLGVVIMVIGMVASSFPKELVDGKVLTLPENEAKSAVGFDFTYTGRKSTVDSETIDITAARGKREIAVPLVWRYSHRGVHASPAIASSLKGDLYVAPSTINRIIVTPTASLTEDGLMSMPAPIPDTSSSLSVFDVRVDQGLLGIRYHADGQQPKEVMLAQGIPVEIDGYVLRFEGWAQSDDHTMGHSVGAYVSVKGNGITESVVVEVSWKPVVWLIWLGTAMITLGGIMATWRRFREKKTQDDGILPDSV